MFKSVQTHQERITFSPVIQKANIKMVQNDSLIGMPALGL